MSDINDRTTDDNHDTTISYFDRVVLEAGGAPSDTKGDIPIKPGEEGGVDAADDGSTYSVKEDDEESDDEMDYDSDECSVCLQTVMITYPLQQQNNLSEESTELLLWRMDKDESFSDWTIEVSIANERNKKTSYHVHKTTLAFGQKKCEYFAALLKSGQFSESSNNTSNVELPEDVARYFPDFLDYLYALPSDCNHVINRKNRRSLQYLAKYFLVQKLTEDVYDFIEKDMQHNLEHVEEYLTEVGSGDIGDEDAMPVFAVMTRVCAANILHIKKGSSLLTSSTPAIFLHIVSVTRTNTDFLALPDSKKDHVCRLAINYIKYHHDCLDANYCKALISELYFPDDTTLAGEVAIDILAIEKAGWETDITNNDCIPVTSMCIAALSRYLSDNAETVKISQITSKLPFKVVSILLEETFNRAHSKNRRNNEEEFIITCELCCARNEFSSVPIGKIAKISVKPTDTMNYIRYLASRQLNVFIYDFRCDEESYGHSWYEMICDTNISPNTVLKAII